MSFFACVCFARLVPAVPVACGSLLLSRSLPALAWHSPCADGRGSLRECPRGLAVVPPPLPCLHASAAPCSLPARPRRASSAPSRPRPRPRATSPSSVPPARLVALPLVPSGRSQADTRARAGGIGQPLSLLLKLNPLVTKLSLYDIRLAAGVAADVDHCNTPSKVRPRIGSPLLAGLCSYGFRARALASERATAALRARDRHISRPRLLSLFISGGFSRTFRSGEGHAAVGVGA